MSRTFNDMGLTLCSEVLKTWRIDRFTSAKDGIQTNDYDNTEEERNSYYHESVSGKRALSGAFGNTVLLWFLCNGSLLGHCPIFLFR